MVSYTPAQTDKNPRGLAVMAMIAGLASVVSAILYLATVTGWVVFASSLVLGVLGIVFGAIALRKQQPKGLAVTGLVAGIVGLLFGLSLLVFALVFVGVFTA